MTEAATTFTVGQQVPQDGRGYGAGSATALTAADTTHRWRPRKCG